MTLCIECPCCGHYNDYDILDISAVFVICNECGEIIQIDDDDDPMTPAPEPDPIRVRM